MPKLLHAPLGACLAQTEFGIFDAEILDAVKYHTTAKADMSLLTKIIYMADYIEPNRDFEEWRNFESRLIKTSTRLLLPALIIQFQSF